MNRRPRSITIISWIFLALGSISLVAGILPKVDITFAQRIAELKGHWYVHLSRISEILAGLFMLYGYNWARWLLVVWLGFHVVVGALHSLPHLIVHILLFVVVSYFLFQKQASTYFRHARDTDVE